MMPLVRKAAMLVLLLNYIIASKFWPFFYFDFSRSIDPQIAAQLLVQAGLPGWQTLREVDQIIFPHGYFPADDVCLQP